MYSDWLMHEGVIRLSVTLFLVILFVALEFRFPRKARLVPRAKRWPGNGAIPLINAMVVRLFLPWLAPFVVALEVARANSGLMSAFALPEIAQCLLALLILDLAIYWQHRLMHRIGWLWRLHRMHHADVDVDVTTALRFHPMEIVLSLMLKSALVWLLGLPPEGVLLFVLWLNAMAMFNHANISLPINLDRVLRRLIVTPDMHRVHHSIRRKEHNRNFGFSLSCWDRWFRSYEAQPEGGHDEMVLGLNETKGQQSGSVVWMLKQPFV